MDNNNNASNDIDMNDISLSTSPISAKINIFSCDVINNNKNEKEAKANNMNYDEEDERLLNESKRLEQLLKQDQTKILQSFQDIRKSIIKTESP
eukprot:CAMPEP_0201572282 /NCGR_PEP_ID=MMETSP0190_2-20130828/15441_1 /ASSEMBLY_ACC=CAM_ASM_000263 /TAXON_ID=37353 /ORGANISM="Rosalina sp." /LENGTH=93 /DNA_ID=CAMNT_0047997821 /DNA_START=527 /DNA_END=808 /DNA_ORIENTATION=+